MKIAITGGTGFVGRHLANRLADDGHHVAAIGRRARPDDLDPRAGWRTPDTREVRESLQPEWEPIRVPTAAPRPVVGTLILAFGITGSGIFLGVLSLVWGPWQLLAVMVVIGLPQLVVSQAMLRRSAGWSRRKRAAVLIVFMTIYAAALTGGILVAVLAAGTS